MTPTGDFNVRAQLEAKQVTRNGIGEEVTTWVLVATRWAKVTPLRGREFFAAGQNQSSVDYRVNLRRPVGLTREMRIKAKGQTLDIVAIIEHDREYEVMCSTGVRNGI